MRLHRLLPVSVAVLSVGIVHADAPNPSRWRADLQGQFFRIESDGNFSCYSENGIDCKRGLPSTDPAQVRPLSCGLRYRERYGITGYDTAGHWCNVKYARLFAAWKDYTILGYPISLSTNANGDPMCASTDGRHCQREMPRAPELLPAVCGTGEAADWCDSPEIVDRPRLRGQWSGPSAHASIASLSYTLRPTARWASAPAPGQRPFWVLRMRSEMSPVSFALLREDGTPWYGRFVAPSPIEGDWTVRLSAVGGSEQPTFMLRDPSTGDYLANWADGSPLSTPWTLDAPTSLATGELFVRLDQYGYRADRATWVEIADAVLARRRPPPRILPARHGHGPFSAGAAR